MVETKCRNLGCTYTSGFRGPLRYCGGGAWRRGPSGATTERPLSLLGSPVPPPFPWEPFAAAAEGCCCLGLSWGPLGLLSRGPCPFLLLLWDPPLLGFPSSSRLFGGPPPAALSTAAAICCGVTKPPAAATRGPSVSVYSRSRASGAPKRGPRGPSLRSLLLQNSSWVSSKGSPSSSVPLGAPGRGPSGGPPEDVRSHGGPPQGPRGGLPKASAWRERKKSRKEMLSLQCSNCWSC